MLLYLEEKTNKAPISLLFANLNFLLFHCSALVRLIVLLRVANATSRPLSCVLYYFANIFLTLEFLSFENCLIAKHEPRPLRHHTSTLIIKTYLKKALYH